MGEKYYCDKCKKEITKYGEKKFFRVKIKIRSYSYEELSIGDDIDLDLCPSCCNEMLCSK